MKGTIYRGFLVAVFLMAIIAAGAVNAEISWTKAQVTDNTANDANVDIAIDNSDVTHRAYERDGKIYYSNSDTNTEEYVADGTKPSIAVGPNNKPQIAFEADSFVEYAEKIDGEWELSSFNGNSPDIAVDKNNNPFIVFRGDYYGDGYQDVMYTTKTADSGFSTSLIFDGVYNYWGGGSADASYFDSYGPVIKVDSESNYHVLVWHHSIYRAPGWTDHSYDLLYTTNADGGNTVSGPARAYTKNAMTLDADGNAHIVSGNIYHATPLPTWSESLLIDGGSNPSIDFKDNTLAVAYEGDGSIFYLEDEGSGFSEPELVDQGSNPVVGLGSTTIDYIQSDGSDNEVMEAYVGKTSNDGEVTPQSCDDENACTIDSSPIPGIGCLAATHTPLTCDDQDDSTTDSCEPTTGCTYTPINPQVPEFGVIAAIGALIAGIGIVAYRRNK